MQTLVERRFTTYALTAGVFRRAGAVAGRSAGTGSQRRITGYAAVFGVEADLGEFVEIIRPGAFDACLDQDVRCLLNHDPNHLLGRTLSKTLRLSSDVKGLRVTADLPDGAAADQLLALIRRGDISQMSFAFSMSTDGTGEVWREDRKGRLVREIHRVATLYDVSPVVFPAYQQTTVTSP